MFCEELNDIMENIAIEKDKKAVGKIYKPIVCMAIAKVCALFAICVAVNGQIEKVTIEPVHSISMDIGLILVLLVPILFIYGIVWSILRPRRYHDTYVKVHDNNITAYVKSHNAMQRINCTYEIKRVDNYVLSSEFFVLNGDFTKYEISTGKICELTQIQIPIILGEKFTEFLESSLHAQNENRAL